MNTRKVLFLLAIVFIMNSVTNTLGMGKKLCKNLVRFVSNQPKGGKKLLTCARMNLEELNNKSFFLMLSDNNIPPTISKTLYNETIEAKNILDLYPEKESLFDPSSGDIGKLKSDIRSVPFFIYIGTIIHSILSGETTPENLFTFLTSAPEIFSSLVTVSIGTTITYLIIKKLNIREKHFKEAEKFIEENWHYIEERRSSCNNTNCLYYDECLSEKKEPEDEL